MPFRPFAPHEFAWFKSSYSGANATECVECAYADDGTLVRDSKRTDGPALRVSGETWRSFINALTRGSLG
ncbi:DUF397 domain-containing protein [Streptomyces sp. 1-11]|uniref:DUF397 domain-containing protein n=1 Tax=Streptomyces sp. 1-11 TaxID=2590549 RepID=UPI00116F6850|nr:DUF397 domain-containing protein [Streptomyces sp. 1-11]GEK03799.1 DUF397 domain-containing protein [Streptomyces sp. 1-11]